jgi:Vacuolar sorting-associated protein 13, N-terminal/N-terminal region of Chorein or VPS13/Repeating coiled region of VPS13
MAKKALLDVLEKTIGKYVLNLGDPSSLNVAVWSGQVELHALELNVAAVNAELDRIACSAPNLALPVRVVSGQFEALQVDVPWSALMSKPVVLRASGLQIAVEPVHASTMEKIAQESSTTSSSAAGGGGAQEQERLRQARLKSIATADEYRLQTAALRKLTAAEQQDDTTSKSKNKSTTTAETSTFGARLVRRIIENLQIEIKNVHISLQGDESSAGVVLNALHLVTTDAAGNRTFVDRYAATTTSSTGGTGGGGKDSFLYKLLQIRGLGIYIDEKQQPLGSRPRPSTTTRQQHHNDSLRAIQEDDENTAAAAADNDGNDDSHSYVLAPLSFQAKLVQADSNLCIEYPKYALQSELASLAIFLTKTQVELARKIALQLKPALDANPYAATTFGTAASRPLFPEYRPISGRIHSSETAREWWQYAYRCVGRLNGRRSWQEFMRAFQQRKKYIPLYKRFAHATGSTTTCPWMTPLSIEEIADLQTIEDDRCISIEGIMTWRGIADAQMEKERIKHQANNSQKQLQTAAAAPKSGIFYSLFGSSSTANKAAATTGVKQQEQEQEEDPPVQLTVEELKALEDLAMEQFAESQLSNDSKLCAIQFVLGSFKIHLTTHGLQQLAAWHMGTVSTTFDANADGSFAFDFDLRSLVVHDYITPQSLFPRILQNQERPNVERHLDRAFAFRMAKSKSGDQLLRLKLNTFELIASPMLVTELKRFVSAETTSVPPLTSFSKANPMLRQSLSGSVDIFYDATDGGPPTISGTGTGGNTSSNVVLPSNADAAVSSLVEAWKAKTEKKSSWILDFDIQAPIVVVPSSCVDPRANVLVFDLGNLTLRYGKIEDDTVAHHKVKEWFATNPRGDVDGTKSLGEPSYDYGCVRISSLTFCIGKASYWRRLVKKHVTTSGGEAAAASDPEDEVIAPISLNMDLGVESRSMDDIPRICSFCVLPSISLRMSPSQMGKIFAVGKAWMQVLKDISPQQQDKDADDGPDDDGASVMSVSTAGSKLREISQLRTSLMLTTSTSLVDRVFPMFHLEARLQGFSLKIATDLGNHGLEAHLVSVAAAASTFSNGSATCNLSMGWFWILDMLDNQLPRCQRLIAHSRLPLDASVFAQDGNYAVLAELERRGVFQDDFSGSSDLADITYRHSGAKRFGRMDPFTTGDLLGDGYAVNAIVDAKFSSLHINWNPHAVKTITAALMRFADTMGGTDMRPSSAGSLILTSPDPDKRITILGVSEASKGEDRPDAIEARQSGIVIRAEMESLQIVLRSARDDLPLFTLTAIRGRTSFASLDDDGMKVFIALGDLSIDSPDMGRTHTLYRTILGLSPGTTESLLSVEYGDGAKALEAIPLDNVDKSKLGAGAVITLSPMRMVYIHAQVMALVEYATEGILGALTRQVASSAAAAAAEIATAGGSQKFFSVHATGFQLLVPHAAYRTNYLAIETGALSVGYTGNPDPGGGHATVSLSDVLLKDSEQLEMQQSPMRMNIDVKLPPVDVGSIEDQAMRVSIEIQSGLFRITRSQYLQFFLLKEENIGEVDLFLRDELQFSGGGGEGDTPGQEDSEVPDILSGLTHAGVALVETQRRMYIDFDIGVLSMELFDSDFDDPIIRLEAVDASVCIKSMVDEEKLVTTVTLRNLVCDDDRIKSFGRQYRSLIYQDLDPDSGSNKSKEDIFFLSYESVSDRSSSIELKVGSPRIVFIPDAISDTLAFLSKPENASVQRMTVHEPVERSAVQVDTTGSSEIETSYVVETLSMDPDLLFSNSYAIKTGDCSVILVDLGSNSLVSGSGSAAETLVVKGIFDVSYFTKADPVSGEVIEMESKLNGDDVEVYTAFGKNLSPVQILDPVRFTAHYSSKTHHDRSTYVDIRIATISELYGVVSMRDFALVNAILSGMSECFDEDTSGLEETSNQESPRRTLSRQEANRILQLDKQLEADEIESSTHSVNSPDDISVPGNVTEADGASSSNQSVKITLPFVRLTFVNDLQGLDGKFPLQTFLFWKNRYRSNLLLPFIFRDQMLC